MSSGNGSGIAVAPLAAYGESLTGDAQSFDAYAARTSPVLWASTAAGFAAAALVWWPLDAFVLPDPERSLPAFHALRGVTAPVNVVGAVLMARVPAVQRRVVPLASATLIVESAWTGWCMAMAGPVGGPWFSFLYVLPLLTILLLTPIGVRALVTATVSFAAWAGYWAHPEADLSSVEARLTGSFLVFATLLSVAIGHGLFALVRENHAQRMALARSEAAWVTLNGELEARVASQTAALRALGAQQDAARDQKGARKNIFP